MSVNSKMTAIADAIRAKTGKTDALTLDAMAEEISNLSVEEIIQHADIPDYVKAEALRVAKCVEEVRQDNSIVFLAMSDNHHYGDQQYSDEYPDANGIQNNESNLHAAMAAKILAYVLKFDFMCQLGDATSGNSRVTPALLETQVGELLSWLRESHKDIPCFHAIGNHDTNIYYYNQQVNNGKGDPATDMMSSEYLYNTFTALSASDDTVFGGIANGGYCYRDFADKKLRVFLLNTSESLTVNQRDAATLGSQRKWFADALVNLNSKSDAAQWSFIVLSHYPADYGGTMPLSELLKAYVEGGSITISIEDGTSSTVSFASKNSAKIVAQFHGHIHNFLTSKLYVYQNGSGVQYDAWRICIPNAQYNRENTYGTVGNYADINFAQDVSYPKSPDSAKDVSFVVNVVNPTEQVIYSCCYGAGEQERIIGYGATVYHKITTMLSNVTISGAAMNVEDGKAYSATLTPDEHCSISIVTVTMGGTDITSSVYANGAISIPKVTGDVVITAKASIALACKNWIPVSTVSGGGSVYNGKGYKDDIYLHNGNETKYAGISTSGFIPVSNGDVIRLENLTFANTSGYHRVVFYNSSYGLIGHVAGTGTYLMNTNMKAVTDANGNYTQFTVNTSITQAANAAYMRICVGNMTETSILTINEEIKYADELEGSYAVTNTLTNVTNSNAATTVTGGASYTATIAAKDGYELKSVKVTMGGVDITSSAYANGVISIAYVTGNLVITATATKAATYTNQLPISTDASGAVYNGKGYKEDTYLSAGDEASRSGVYTSGFIPINGAQTIRFLNCGIQQSQSNHRFSCYDASKAVIANSTSNTTQLASKTGVTMVWDEDGYLKELTRSDSYGQQAKFFRFCSGYLGADSVVTVNEAIE